MSDPISVLCLILLLWLVVRDLSRKGFRPEPPLLPQHQDNVRYTVPLYAAEQQSVSEHQRQEEALPPKAQYVHLEHEQSASAKALQTVQPSVPSVPSVPPVSEERNETPPQASPRQINETGQSPILVPQSFISPTSSGGEPTIDVFQRGALQAHQATGAPLVPSVGGEVLWPPQDDVSEGSGDYARLRERAKEEIEAIRKYRQEKKLAQASGQSRLVEGLAQEIQKHKTRRKLYDEQASSLIFAKNNKYGALDLIDLHGLTAKEAANHVKCAINDARERGIATVRIIVGKGLHSLGPPVLKPSMLKLMRKLKLSAEVDPSNEGVIVVQLIPASNPFPPAVFQEWNHTLLQPSLPLPSQLGQSPVLLPDVYLSSTEPNHQLYDTSRGPVQIPIQTCQITPVFNAGEGVPQLPQIPINNDAGNGSNDFVVMRERAKEERKMMLNCRKEKRLALARGQMALARELEEKESEYEKRSESLDAQASDKIFAENNKSGPLDTVVMLGLKPKEAKNIAKFVIQVAREQGMTELRMVVGEGPYSSNGAQPIKPVLFKFLGKKCGIPVHVDPTNNRVLVVAIGPECDAI